ncbi:hypothetical protein C8Q75DRAFT_804850 [Abortiporus biennis]|nr:hypothetical protein C8Q75DRAFT_804850 [Abortiporus biennis]
MSSAALQTIKRFRTRELASVLKPTTPSTPLTTAGTTLLNPFIARKNPETGRWAPPKYSLRRQAELVKKAKESGTLHLLPAGLKFGPSRLAKLQALAQSNETSTSKDAIEGEWAETQVNWSGEVKETEVKGADIGNKLYAGKKRMFKGHKWERMREKRQKKIKLLMQGMPERIERFRSTYNSSRPNPVSKPRATKYSKLPF